MRCLCETDMIDVTDFDSGDMWQFACPECGSMMQIRKETFDAYSQREQARSEIDTAFRNTVRSVIRDEKARQF